VTGTAVPGGEQYGAPSGWTHLPALDGLRALAVVAVLLFHAGHLDGGFLGVDLFFALSGFLITSLLLRDAERGDLHLRTFWGRRFRRLLPAVFGMIVIVTLLVWAFGEPATLDGVLTDGPWAVLYLANWHSIAEAGGYWESFENPGMFDHLWSLAIEEQFYVLWPIVVLLVWRWAARPSRTLAQLTTVGIVASVGAMVLLYDGGDPTRVYVGTDTRAASVLVGALAATAVGRAAGVRVRHRLGPMRLDVLVGVLGLGLLWSWVTVDGASSSVLYRGGMFAHSAAAAAVVLLVAASPASRIGHLLGWAPLAFVGRLSYGLYLWHWPIYAWLSPDRVGWEGAPLTVLRIAASAAAALVSLHLLEDPVRYRATWARGRRGVLALGTAVATVLGLLVLVPAPQSEIAAFDPGSIVDFVPSTSSTTTTTVAPTTTGTAAGAAATENTTTATTTTTVTATATATTVPPSTTLPRTAISTVVWAGDSVAFDQAPAVDAALTAAGLTVDTEAAFPALRLTGEAEFSLLDRVLRRVVATDADLVVLQLTIWDREADPATFAEDLTNLDAMLDAYGVRLLLVTPPFTGIEEFDVGLAQVVDMAAAGSDELGIELLSTVEVWGPDGEVDLDDDGVPERKVDRAHVCPSGAARFASWLTAQLAERFDGVVPAPPGDWATGPWTTEPRFDEPIGSCAPLS
jgi:peptidoglycan/LPS O-acetylase OafA/YrhL